MSQRIRKFTQTQNNSIIKSDNQFEKQKKQKILDYTEFETLKLSAQEFQQIQTQSKQQAQIQKHSTNRDTSLKWTKSQQDLLFSLHQKIGNKWAKISRLMPGKSINTVKNKFYCTLRRGYKNINKFISAKRKKNKFKKINESTLQKIFQIIGNHLDGSRNISQQFSVLSIKIKEALIQMSDDKLNVFQNEKQIFSHIQRIYKFNQLYKNKERHSDLSFQNKEDAILKTLNEETLFQNINQLSQSELLQKHVRQKQSELQPTILDNDIKDKLKVIDDVDTFLQQQHCQSRRQHLLFSQLSNEKQWRHSDYVLMEPHTRVGLSTFSNINMVDSCFDSCFDSWNLFEFEKRAECEFKISDSLIYSDAERQQFDLY